MEKTGFAYFVQTPRRIEDLIVPHAIEWERAFEIVRTVELAKIDYENFITDMRADRAFLENAVEPCSRGKTWRCLLIRRRGQADGVLVVPGDGCYVGWAAYASGT
ncbi:MAG: hypothetical protein IJF88_01805 [Oscillospiraceae bacterium]|nr:hypothetical protein [Oscillospiraceae bacterium]